jgi:predicted GNAT superfamily acetyltransferase
LFGQYIISIESKISYQTLLGIPAPTIIDQLVCVYSELFEDAKVDFFLARIHSQQDLITNLCYDDSQLIGFKLGYQYDQTTFYSWVGGVLPEFRKQGVAQKLMQLQHASAKEKGYQKVRTKSMNRFKPMMILNLKHGFDIVQVYTNDSQQTKIVFEKNLV